MRRGRCVTETCLPNRGKSTLSGPFVFAFVFRFSPNTHPLSSVAASRRVVYRVHLSDHGSSHPRCRGAHPTALSTSSIVIYRSA